MRSSSIRRAILVSRACRSSRCFSVLRWCRASLPSWSGYFMGYFGHASIRVCRSLANRSAFAAMS